MNDSSHFVNEYVAVANEESPQSERRGMYHFNFEREGKRPMNN